MPAPTPLQTILPLLVSRSTRRPPAPGEQARFAKNVTNNRVSISQSSRFQPPAWQNDVQAREALWGSSPSSTCYTQDRAQPALVRGLVTGFRSAGTCHTARTQAADSRRRDRGQRSPKRKTVYAGCRDADPLRQRPVVLNWSFSTGEHRPCWGCVARPIRWFAAHLQEAPAVSERAFPLTGVVSSTILYLHS